MILLVLIMALAISPSLAGPFIRRNPAILAAVVERLRYTPPFGAAAAMTHADLERRLWPCDDRRLASGDSRWSFSGISKKRSGRSGRPPNPSRSRGTAPSDRVGALFGPRIGPFVAHWLCFYVRATRGPVSCFCSRCPCSPPSLLERRVLLVATASLSLHWEPSPWRRSWPPRALPSTSSVTWAEASGVISCFPPGARHSRFAPRVYASLTLGARWSCRLGCSPGSSLRPVLLTRACPSCSYGSGRCRAAFP